MSDDLKKGIFISWHKKKLNLIKNRNEIKNREHTRERDQIPNDFVLNESSDWTYPFEWCLEIV